MAWIRRLTDSCVFVRTDQDATLIDPGFHTYQEAPELEALGDVSRVLVTHRHRDHLSADFVNWLIRRKSDLVVYANQDVADILADKSIAVSTEAPTNVEIEDVLHGRIPNGDQPPNRSFTVEGLFTHPGDSREPTVCGDVLALPLMVPWDSMTGAVEFARRLKPKYVLPIHDFYLSPMGRAFARGMARDVLADDGIEVVDVDWGHGFTV